MGIVRRKSSDALRSNRSLALHHLEAAYSAIGGHIHACFPSSKANANFESYTSAFRERYLDMVALAATLKPRSLLSVGISFGVPEVAAHACGVRAVFGTDYRPEKTREYASGASANGVQIVEWDLVKQAVPECIRLQGPFEMLWCTEVLEHLRIHPGHVIAELCDLVADNGYLLVTIPNAGTIRNHVSLLKGKNFAEPLGTYDRNEICNSGKSVFDKWVHVREPGWAEMTETLRQSSPACFTWDVFLPFHGRVFVGNWKGCAGRILQRCCPRLRDTVYCLGKKLTWSERRGDDAASAGKPPVPRHSG